MLTFHTASAAEPVRVDANDIPRSQDLPADVSWIDAFDPTPDERLQLERLMKVSVPTREDLVEIETSSRLSVEDGALIMSLPATRKDDSGYPVSTPVGFVVTADRLATIRFASLPSFENLSKKIGEKGRLSDSGIGAAITVIEIMIDHIADLLERVGGDLDDMSRSIFSGEYMAAKRRPRRANRVLMDLLEQVGRSGDLISKVSETLLGLSRMAPFLAANSGPSLTPDLKRRLKMISADTKSIHEFQEHLASKTQFLLDTLLGLANIEQNNVFRVLTVVSVIGIPPTFVASMYGMNFKFMPELEWQHGYAFGLTIIALSALIPAVWFKVKGWW